MKNAQELVPGYLLKLIAQEALPKWVYALAVGVADYILPSIAPSVWLAACALVCLDTASGMVRAKVTGQEITSAKMGRFLTKSFSYAVAVITIALSFHVVPRTQEFQPAAVTTIITGIAMTETYSIFENLKAMGYSLPGPVSDLIDRIFKKGGDK